MRPRRQPETPPLIAIIEDVEAKRLAQRSALEHERRAGRSRRRNKNSNWTFARQGLVEIQKLIRDRHRGPCGTDDGEIYFKAALPWLIAQKGGLNAEGCRSHLLDWVRHVTPQLDEHAILECIADAQQRNERGKLYWTAAQLGRLLRLTVAEREKLGITTIRPGGMTTRQFNAYRRARKAAAERERRATKGATPREESAAQTKPWEELELTRRTYYRRKRTGTIPVGGTVSCLPDTKYLLTTTERWHPSGRSVPGPARTGGPRQSVGAGGPSPGVIPKGVQIIRPLPPPLPEGRGFRHPDLLEEPLALGTAVWAVIDTYVGGIMPIEVIGAVRTMQRARMIRQEDVARQIGISRPQLSNALKQRFGLSRAAATSVREWLVAA